MAPGPPNLGANRFGVLDESPPKKRKNTKANMQPFPILPSTNKPNHKFVVISSNDEKKALSSYSCFAVHRALKLISKDILSVSELRDGNLLVLVDGPMSAEKFIKSKELVGICPIKASYHRNLNYTKGTVFAPFLNNVSEEEIVSEMSNQGVVGAYKFLKNVEGKSVPTGVVLLTFDLYHLPEKVDISWRAVLVREHIPNPMRCKKCQLLGHTQKYCSKASSCVNCNLPPHEPQILSRTLCANCSGDHLATSNTSPRYVQAKSILKIKIQAKCTMRQALTIYQQQQNIPTLSSVSPSFSEVAKTGEPKKNDSKVSSSSNILSTSISPNKTSPTNIQTNQTKTPELNSETTNILNSSNITNSQPLLINSNKKDTTLVNASCSLNVSPPSPMPLRRSSRRSIHSDPEAKISMEEELQSSD